MANQTVGNTDTAKEAQATVLASRKHQEHILTDMRKSFRLIDVTYDRIRGTVKAITASGRTVNVLVHFTAMGANYYNTTDSHWIDEWTWSFATTLPQH